MSHPTFPKNEDELTPELLTVVLSEDRPGLKVEGLTIVAYGPQSSLENPRVPL